LAASVDHTEARNVSSSGLNVQAVRRDGNRPESFHPGRPGRRCIPGGAMRIGGRFALRPGFSRLSVPGIDMAAHLGGLVVGFLCGLLLTAFAPARAQGIGRLALALRRSAVLVVLSAMLAGLGLKACDAARDVILADPKVGKLVTSQRDNVDAWNAFNAAVEPVLQEFDRIAQGIDDLTTGLQNGHISEATATRTIARLKDDCKGLEPRISGLPAAHGEIEEIRKHIASAQSFQLRMLTSIEQFLATQDEARINGPSGLSASAEAYGKEFQTVVRLRDAYFKAHGMQRVDEAP
jgi:hypothetical protein